MGGSDKTKLNDQYNNKNNSEKMKVENVQCREWGWITHIQQTNSITMYTQQINEHKLVQIYNNSSAYQNFGAHWPIHRILCYIIQIWYLYNHSNADIHDTNRNVHLFLQPVAGIKSILS